VKWPCYCTRGSRIRSSRTQRACSGSCSNGGYDRTAVGHWHTYGWSKREILLGSYTSTPNSRMQFHQMNFHECVVSLWNVNFKVRLNRFDVCYLYHHNVRKAGLPRLGESLFITTQTSFKKFVLPSQSTSGDHAINVYAARAPARLSWYVSKSSLSCYMIFGTLVEQNLGTGDEAVCVWAKHK
jgi:hypothetical protein